MAPLSARLAAARVLGAYERNRSNLSKIISDSMRSLPAEFPDRGFVRDLVWGAVRHRNTLDWVIGLYSRRLPESSVRTILRLGLFQILYFSERVPAYAAVNESVNLCAALHRPNARGMVNAVLRRTIRSKDDLPWPDEERNPVRALSLRHSHPEWLVERWLERWGRDETATLLQANNTLPRLSVRANTFTVTRDGLETVLSQENVETVRSAYSPDGLLLAANPEIEKLGSYREGLFILQDQASQLVSRIVAPRKGETILDLCAGSGIKTSHLAALANGRARIVAVDKDPAQLEALKENFRRLDAGPAETFAADARQFGGIEADRILIDAPCSGLGAVRRKPDIKWNRKPEDVTVRYPALQKEILSNAARLLKEGGVIVYSTCTTEPEENEDVVRGFVAAHPGFVLENITLPAGAGPLLADEGCFFSSFPHRHGTDGFFAAKIVRSTRRARQEKGGRRKYEQETFSRP